MTTPPNSVSRPYLSAGYPCATDTLINLPHMHATLQYLPFDLFLLQGSLGNNIAAYPVEELTWVVYLSFPSLSTQLQYSLSLFLSASVACTRMHAHTHKGMKNMLTKSLGAYQE